MMDNDHRDFSELCFVARRLQIIGVNSASCERLFSDMGYIHSKRRNRLSFEKVLHIAQVRSNLKKKRRPNQSEEQSRRARHASDIADASESSSVLTNVATTEDIVSPEVDGTDDSEAVDVEEQLVAMTTEWSEILEEEGTQDEEDELEFNTHIAEKKRYKWKLASLLSTNNGGD